MRTPYINQINSNRKNSLVFTKGYRFLSEILCVQTFTIFEYYVSLLLYKALRSFLKIFPAADLGIESTNSIPPSKRLYSATCSLTNLLILVDISSDSTILFITSNDNWSLNTTYALGTSPK